MLNGLYVSTQLPSPLQRGNLLLLQVKKYFDSVGGKHPLLFYAVLIGGYILNQVIFTFLTWFLGLWAAQYQTNPNVSPT